MDFDAALGYLHGRLRLGEKYGNARMEALLERLGSPHARLNAVHIAGTKGKGSTTVMAASVLQAAGYRVGAYFSPYVYDVRERVQINGEPISRADFARLLTEIRPHVEALERTPFGPTTEFELKTALGFCYFAERQVDYAVVEVGLGGRLDATNVLPKPLVTVITNIGYDHMELLGDTLGLIAGEKAGIVKPGVPCVTGVPVGGEADVVISRICAERGAPLVHVQMGPEIRTPRRVLSEVALGLRGAFQQGNAAIAVAALDAIVPDALPPLSDEAVRDGLGRAWLPGRLELAHQKPTVILDGAHNEMAAEALADALRQEYGANRRRLILVVGMKRNHDPATFLKPLVALKPAAMIITQPTFRPADPAEIAAAARALGLTAICTVGDVAGAARAAWSLAGADDLICVTGSFYTVGDAPPALWSSFSAHALPERNL